MTDTAEAIRKAEMTLNYLGANGGKLNEKQAEQFMYWTGWHATEQEIAWFRWWNWVLTPWRIPRQLRLRKAWRESGPNREAARMLITEAKGRIDLPRWDTNA